MSQFWIAATSSGESTSAKLDFFGSGSFGIDGVGTPSLYPLRVQPAFFATALWADPSSGEYRQRYANVGAQVDLQFSALHWYGVTLSAGYALGFGNGRRPGGEWMISLKIM